MTARCRSVGAAERVAATASGGEAARVPEHRLRRDQHPAAGGIDPPTEVDVGAGEGPGSVQPVEGVPHVAADQQSRGADREHVGDVVVLTLVELARLETCFAMAGRIDGYSDLDQDPAVPAEHLGA